MTELTEEQVAELRRRYGASSSVGGYGTAAVHRRLKRFAEEYGVSTECISAIVKGRPWRHLAQPQQPDLPQRRKR